MKSLILRHLRRNVLADGPSALRHVEAWFRPRSNLPAERKVWPLRSGGLCVFPSCGRAGRPFPQRRAARRSAPTGIDDSTTRRCDAPRRKRHRTPRARQCVEGQPRMNLHRFSSGLRCGVRRCRRRVESSSADGRPRTTTTGQTLRLCASALKYAQGMARTGRPRSRHAEAGFRPRSHRPAKRMAWPLRSGCLCVFPSAAPLPSPHAVGRPPIAAEGGHSRHSRIHGSHGNINLCNKLTQINIYY